MKVVVDTNVLVSGTLSPDGSPGKIVRMILDGNLQVCYDLRILSEYQEAFGRPRFGISPVLSAKLLEQIRIFGESARTLPLSLPLPDQDDETFLEVALSGRAECLITGNLKHFPLSCRQGMRVLSPKEFLEFYADQQAGSSGKVKSPSARYVIKRRIKSKKS